MGNNYSLNRAIAVLLIAIHKLNKEIALLKLEISAMERWAESEASTIMA